MAKNIRKGTSICITSAKGGVGKTITTLNLAGIYESMQKKVLIIDLDLTNGGIALALNCKYDKSIYTLFQDLSINNYDNFNDYVTKYDDFIDILPCSVDPRDAFKINDSLIDVILERACFIYDIVLIDVNHILSDLNLYTLDKVDKILFVTSNDLLDLKNLKSVLKIFEELDITKYKILLNNSCKPFNNYFSMYDIRNILKTNIDYTISSEFFIPDLDKFLMTGNILTLDKKVLKTYGKDYANLLNIGADLLDRGDKNE